MTTSPTGPASDGETDYGPGGQRYNDDLLLAQEARERAEREFKNIFHVLDHEKMREAFRLRNTQANQAKRLSHLVNWPGWGAPGRTCS